MTRGPSYFAYFVGFSFASGDGSGAANHEVSSRWWDAAALAAWLLKDLGWILVLAQLAVPAALVAVCIEARALWRSWETGSWAKRLHQVAFLFWLIGNAIWMVGELFYEEPPLYVCVRKLPWYNDQVPRNQQVYEAFVRVSRGVFLVPLALLLLLYAMCLLELRCRCPRKVHSLSGSELLLAPACGVVTPEVYMMAFVFPWIAKDLLWTMEWGWPTLPMLVFVLILVLDALRRYRLVESFVEATWAVGNGLWIFAELGRDDREVLWRLLGAASLLAGLVLTLPPLFGLAGPGLPAASPRGLTPGGASGRGRGDGTMADVIELS